MVAPTTISVTDLVGNEETTGATRVASLISLIYRTVSPETWFVEGGTGGIRAFFNAGKKQWYVVVFSEAGNDVITAIQKVLGDLKT